MPLKRISIQNPEVNDDGVIPVMLIGSVLAWPISIYWQGIHHDADHGIWDDPVQRNGNWLGLPASMDDSGPIHIDYWADDSGCSCDSDAVTANDKGTCDRVRMIISNHVRDATLSSNYTTATSLENVKTEWRSRVLRNINPAEPLVICGNMPRRNGLPSARMFSGLAFSAHTLSVAATVTLELLDGDCETGSVVYSSGELYPTLIKPLGDFIFGVDPWGEVQDDTADVVFAHFFAEKAAGSFRLTITDPGNPNGFWDISQIFLGDTLQLDNNFSYGFSIKWANAQKLQRTEGGSLVTIGNKQQWRELALPFEFMTEHDRKVMARQQRSSPGQAVFLSAFPKGTDNEQREFAMSCKFESPQFSKTHYRNWQSSITFLET